MERKETPIKSAFFGFSKSGTCPVCSAELELGLTVGSDYNCLCISCGEYSEVVGGKTLRQMDIATIYHEPAFAAALPWIMRRPMHTTLHFDMNAALTELVMTKKASTRVLEATWPEGCCVCGNTATRTESIGEHFLFNPPGSGGPFLKPQQEGDVVAQGVPHCGEHKDGARFKRTTFNNPVSDPLLGLHFRSYRYQTEFRKLNQWKWSFVAA